jgi:EEF1A lysine methyltransferase 4
MLQDEMASDGYQDIVSIDYSPVCIRQQEQWKHKACCKFAVVDVRQMPQFGDASFHSVIDKGTLDSLLCGPSSFTEAYDALAEVLTPFPVV